MNKDIGDVLIAVDLIECNSVRAIMVGLLHSSCKRGSFVHHLGSKLFVCGALPLVNLHAICLSCVIGL